MQVRFVRHCTLLFLLRRACHGNTQNLFSLCAVGNYGFIYGTGEGLETDLRGKMFPALNVKLDGSAMDLIEHAPTQHIAIVYGELINRLSYFLRIMDIEQIRIA